MLNGLCESEKSKDLLNEKSHLAHWVVWQVSTIRQTIQEAGLSGTIVACSAITPPKPKRGGCQGSENSCLLSLCSSREVFSPPDHPLEI
jgi:hypothetical protein